LSWVLFRGNECLWKVELVVSES